MERSRDEIIAIKHIELISKLAYINETVNDLSDFSYREFTSYSKGKGIKRKEPVDVEILAYKDAAFVAENGGDFKNSNKKLRINLDCLAMEVLGGTQIDPTIDNLIDLVKIRQKIKKEIKDISEDLEV